MPNWCENDVTFYHSDKNELKRLFTSFYQKEELCQYFIPIPEQLKNTEAATYSDKEKQFLQDKIEIQNKRLFGYSTWYDFCCDKWGTKWDASNICSDDKIFEKDVSCKWMDGKRIYSVEFHFDTPWGAPIGVYKEAEKYGYIVDAKFYSAESGFCGTFKEGEEKMYDISSNVKNVRKSIPEMLDDFFGISSYLEEYIADNSDYEQSSTDED